MKTKALFMVLSRKLKDGEVIFLDNLDFRIPKSKEAKSVLTSLSKIKEFSSLNRRKNAAFIALEEKNKNVLKSFNNFGNLEVGQIKDLNILDLLKYRYFVMADPKKSIAVLSSRLK